LVRQRLTGRESGLTEFFRHCPGCGRRFHIKLEDKKMVSLHRESVPGYEQLAIGRIGTGGSAYTPFTLHEGKPMIIDVEEFQYLYKCGHCGHEWSEKHLEEHREH